MKNITKLFFLFSTIILFSSSILAQEETNKTKDIRELLNVSGSAQIATQMMDQMMVTFKQMTPDIPATFWDEFMSEIDENELVELIVPIYDKHFSEADVKELIAFYKSPIGEKMVSKLPSITQESMVAGQTWGEKIAAKAMQKMQEKGYK